MTQGNMYKTEVKLILLGINPLVNYGTSYPMVRVFDNTKVSVVFYLPSTISGR